MMIGVAGGNMVSFKIENGHFIEVEEMDCTSCKHNAMREKGTRSFPYVICCMAHLEVYIGNGWMPDCPNYEECDRDV